MKQAILREPKEKIERIKEFSGISGREVVDSSFLQKGLNLSSRYHPYLSTRLPREEMGTLPGTGTVNGILKEQAELSKFTNLTFVRGTSFYYRGMLVEPHPILGKKLMDGKKVLVDFDGKIFILPDLLYYDYTVKPGDGLKKMDNQMMFHFALVGGSASGNMMHFTINKNLVDENQLESTSKTFMEMKLGDWLTIRNGSDVAGIKTMKTVEEQEFRYALSTDWTRAEVKKIEEGSMSLQLQLQIEQKDGTSVTFSVPDSGYIYLWRHVPQMDCAIGANNRIWGACGTRIYVSAEGSPLNYNRFANLEGDSYAKNLTDRGGKVVTFATLNGKVVVLKESTMYQIYGSDATEYYIPYTIDKGCIDKDSVVNLDNKLYFLSDDGVYSFDGSKVKKTGLNRTFRSGFAGTDGNRYFLVATTREGERELWVYDSENDEWYTEEENSFASFIRVGSNLCALKEDGSIIRFGTGEERFSWEMETKPITAGVSAKKRPGELFLRVKGARNTSATVWVKTDREEEYRLVANILFDGKEERAGHIFRLKENTVNGISIPLNALPCDNLTLKIRGKGEITLFEMEIKNFIS